MSGNETAIVTDWLIRSGAMGNLIGSMDWSKTPLGSIESWSQSLRTTVSLCLASNFPINIIWGAGRVQIYNDGYRTICGDKHPHSMGQDFKECWFSAWDAIGEPFERATVGETAFLENRRMFLDRNGYLEETFFTFSFSPIRDETGGVAGLFHPVTEVTQQNLTERRLQVLRDLAEHTANAKTIAEACRLITESLAVHERDLPFTLLYQFDQKGRRANLVSLTGLDPDSQASPAAVEFESACDRWALSNIAEFALDSQGGSISPRQVNDLERRFGPLVCSPYPECSQSALVMPITLPGVAHPWGAFIAGVSPRRALDEVYQTFYTLLGKAVTTAIANAHAYEEERKRAEALVELDRAKTAFFSNVSHEFRTPLTLMLAPLEDVLASLQDQPDLKEQLQVVHRNGLRLLKLVNTLLDFSRIESDRVQAVYEPTDLATFTAELASVFRSAIEKANLRLLVDCAPLPEPIYVDREMWEKIVLNLLSNAFKFTFTGEIAVRLYSVGQQVKLSVEDTGIGISATEIPRLFERFYQVKGSQGRTFEGSGIGLSLVQELVKLHGGTVQIQSLEGEGSCFTVSIPTGYAHLPPDRIGAMRTVSSTSIRASTYVEEALRWLTEADEIIQPSANREEQGKAFAPSYSHTSSSPLNRILLVDDNADMRDYVRRILSQRWQVETAANGAIALQMIQQQLPDLVLTDVMMPEVDGFQLLNTLRADPITRSIPIILLSARAGEEATVEGLEAGADDYLIKPFSARELMARVETQLQMSRLRQELAANRFKNEFLRTITHELQSPLATILGWARFLQTKSLDRDAMARALAAIERNATIEAKLIQDLLDVANILSGKLRLKSQMVDWVALIQSVVTTFRPVAASKNIQLIEMIADISLSNVVADGDRLRQVISNLLENAIKFTPEGGQVTIELERFDSGVQITVSDTGIGIRPDFLPYVFDRFTQAEVPSRHTPGGVGIGLAIARHIVELHHGTIEVASEGEGHGVTFIIKLPLINLTPVHLDPDVREGSV